MCNVYQTKFDNKCISKNGVIPTKYIPRFVYMNDWYKRYKYIQPIKNDTFISMASDFLGSYYTQWRLNYKKCVGEIHSKII